MVSLAEACTFTTINEAGGRPGVTCQRAVGAETEALGGGGRVDLSLGELALEGGGGARYGDGAFTGGLLVVLVCGARRWFRGLDRRGVRGFDGGQGDACSHRGGV